MAGRSDTYDRNGRKRLAGNRGVTSLGAGDPPDLGLLHGSHTWPVQVGGGWEWGQSSRVVGSAGPPRVAGTVSVPSPVLCVAILS